MSYPILKLKPGKNESTARRHPWIFSGALQHISEVPREGDKVYVADSKGLIIATGHYGTGSIAVRVLAFAKCLIDDGFYEERLRNALELRESLGLYKSEHTDAFRLVHGEGDGLPGLVVDIYRKVAVVQTHSAGMQMDFQNIESALKICFEGYIEFVISKSAEAKGSTPLLKGQPSETEILENGHRFKANWATGQKTGFFLDQRDNRALISSFSEGRTILNAFCYSGGFSIYALKSGAKNVHSLDSSEKALNLLDEHILMNDLTEAPHSAIKADALTYLAAGEARDAQYDLIVLDPPAFAKHRSARHAAVQAYKRINAKAMEIIAPGGILFTFSCSQVVTPDLFNHTIAAAAIESGRNVRILHHLHQPADHPVSIFHPEGEYLKGLVLAID
jgi:23S rRNA (cytosine1962-C5)-methyltransferase